MTTIISISFHSEIRFCESFWHGRQLNILSCCCYGEEANQGPPEAQIRVVANSKHFVVEFVDRKWCPSCSVNPKLIRNAKEN